MAGSTLAYPLNGAANWETFPDIVQKIQAGYMRLSLTNFGNDNEPQIAAGSTLDVNGTCCVFSAAESITGWAGIANSTDVYIKVVVSGSTVTAVFTTDAPTWSATKQGWYDGNDRYIGGLYKDGSGNYVLKWLYPQDPGDPINQEMIREGETRPLLEKILEIGDWNMDANNSTTVNHDFGTADKVLFANAFIRNDDGVRTHPLIGGHSVTVGDYRGGDITGIEADHFGLTRTVSGYFDSVDFDATSYNRGWIYIRYRA